MTIKCASFDQFMDVIAGLVSRGLTFKANAETLTVDLTGGY